VLKPPRKPDVVRPSQLTASAICTPFEVAAVPRAPLAAIGTTVT
jgi:hypothetical protein